MSVAIALVALCVSLVSALVSVRYALQATRYRREAERVAECALESALAARGIRVAPVAETREKVARLIATDIGDPLTHAMKNERAWATRMRRR